LANNRIQVKRTNVSGRTPNTTNSSNSQYIEAGEFALNMPDGILYTSNGSSLIAVGSNNSNVNVTNKLTANSIIAGKVQHSPVEISKILTSFDSTDSDTFSRIDISKDGSTLAVGAWGWEGATGTNRGGVYIYDWNGSNWIQRGSVLEAADAADSDGFGFSVSLSSNGSILAVGLPNWEGASGTDRGGVYIYDWNGSSWVQRGSVLEAADAADTDGFGVDVSLSDDGAILIVGANLWEGATGTNRGGVYIYDWNGSSWVQRGSVLEAADAADNDAFGISVSISSNGSILAVGANTWEGTTGTNRGGVYIYDWNGSAWVQRGSVLEASDAADSDAFGRYVSLASDGSILAVSAFTWEGATGTNRGGVYIYDWNGSSWVQRGSVLEADDAADSDQFGVSVSICKDGSILAVGSQGWEGSTGTSRGAVYTYTLDGTMPSRSSVATGSGWIETTNSSLVARTAGLERITVDVNGNVSVANTITLKSINAAGSIGSAGQVLTVDANGQIIWEDIQPTNSLYVAKNGNDTTGDGSITRPYLTIKKALSVSTAGTTIKISSGIYTEDNPLTVPADVSVIGESLRNVTVIPQTTNLDVFWLNNGSYITELTLKNYVSPAAAFAFPDSGAGNITRSPYVLNCTSLTTTGIGLHIDGSKATGNRSMIAGLYTIINQGGIGVKITNKGYSQLVNIYTICTDISILAEQGGFCTLNCSDTSFGNYGLVANGTSASLYSGVTFGDDQFGSQIVIKGLSQTPYINNVLKLTGDDTYYTVVGVTPMVSNTSTVTIQERIAIPVANNTSANFYQRSYIAAAGHAFEYVGTGTNLATASPFAGGIVISNNQSISVNGGVVNYTSTDQFGNFNINNNLTINGINATIEGDAFQRSLFGLMTPYILAIEGAQ
jgi:hypothetical protein